jgi:MFS transporter, DHA2 family, multidrug resistance protein
VCGVRQLHLHLTPTTPTWLLALSTSLQGAALAPLLLGASNISTGEATLSNQNDVSTSYFFVRQMGNTFGVTAATVMFDHRQTLHSARLIDAANRSTQRFSRYCRNTRV